MTRVEHFGQLAATPPEPLLKAIELELLERGWMRASSLAWDDRVCALMDGQTVIAAIAWRPMIWRRAAFITLGGTRKGHRGQGCYRACFTALVEHLEAEQPDLDCIESGHHVDNVASREMHEALGRRLDGLTYSFPLGDGRCD